MSSHGVEVVACVALGVPWALAGSWRACDGTLSRTARAALGGVVAAELAWLAYGVLDLAGLAIRFERIELGDLGAFGLAAVVGLVEEGAKLAGALIAMPQTRCDARDRFRIVLAVAAAFATVEAVLVLPGAAWPVVLGRAAFAPVAHALLAVPVAIAFGRGAGSASAVTRIAGGLVVASALHALGDFALTRPQWGRAAFAATLLVPALWLYMRSRTGLDRRAGERRSPLPASAVPVLPGALAPR